MENAKLDPRRAVLRRIRVRKEDSAYIYAVLEAYEGVTAYSTLPSPAECTYRDLELQVPEGFLRELDELLSRLEELIVDLGEVSVPGI
jgi:hypothetical protein